MQTVSKQVINKINKIAELLAQGWVSIKEAADLYVSLLNDEPDIEEVILSHCPTITPGLLLKLEAIGNNEILPDTLLLGSHISSRVQNLPVELQQTVMDKPIPVAVKQESGQIKIEHKRINEITPREASVVFAEDRIRSTKEQTSILEEKEKRSKLHDMRYIIVDDKVEFLCRCTFSAVELEAIVEKMKAASLKNLQTNISRRQINAH